MNTTDVYTTTIDSPLGELTISATEAGVRAVTWRDDDAARVPVGARDGESVAPRSNDVADEAARQLGEYFAGARRDFDVPLDPVGTDFQQAAWTALCTIPYGETVSYGEQAGRMGDVRKARAVGAANGRNPISIIVPCHRVVGADGSLTGFAGGLDSKAWLLDHERRHAGLTLDFE
jgi:methylated-DNA-[protein]-cysteine S-methyltransferase